VARKFNQKTRSLPGGGTVLNLIKQTRRLH